MGIPVTERMGFLLTATMGVLFTMTLGIQLTVSTRIGYGYRRLHILIAREGWRVNHKRVYRLYREEGLAMRKRPPRRRKACLKRDLRPLAAEKNECWSMDFMSDELFDGRRIRLLTIVDNHTRESLAIHIGRRVRGFEVVEVLERIMKEHGRPQTIRVDNVLSLESSSFSG
jgi:putative transposase